MSSWSLLRRERCGQTLAEFAVVSLIFIILVVGIVDLSRAVYAYNMVKNAAREGARFAVLYPQDATGIEQAAKGLAIGLDMDLLAVDSELVECSGGRCYSVKVTVEYWFLPLTALISQSIDGGTGNGFGMSGTSTMRLEAPVPQ